MSPALSVVATVVVLALTATACAGADQRPGPAADGWNSPASATGVLRTLPARLERDGVTITVGDPTAAHTVHVYEEPRCPYCRRFEAVAGAKLAALAANGSVKIRYTIASFLDDRRGDKGSALAAAALRTALDLGVFPEFRAALMASGPARGVADCTAEFLTRVAEAVAGLRAKGFEAKLRSGVHDSWAADSQRAFAASRAATTPTVAVDGVVVRTDAVKYDLTAFTALLAEAGIR
ncbi:thioredoxin domain-containing protein [Streptomyces sp. NPDC086554]|uniref:DsbA family protein n=1 Tax=Streptomyces sp. NPDC086554 TaxID=3154864 RepID=UPI003412B97F